MNTTKLADFSAVWFLDFEFCALPGNRPKPVCLVARELKSGQLIREWLFEKQPIMPPMEVGENSLLVSFFASAELGCFLELGWPMPKYVLDLYAEFRCRTNGMQLPCGSGLLGAMAYFGLDFMGTAEKQTMRDLVIHGGPFSPEDQQKLLDYCQSDVDALPKLLEKLRDKIDLSLALVRGRYLRAVALMEHNGIPIDIDILEVLRKNWGQIKSQLVSHVDPLGEVYEGEHFRQSKWELYLHRHGIAWPRNTSGALALDDETFRQMAKCYPEVIGKWRELRQSMGQMRLADLTVGSDGRNRCLLSPFSSRTGRNQPSTAKYIFGPSTWMRSLIKPQPGNSIAIIDWSQQEFGIAAALSQDPLMIDAYNSGDPYLAFARQAKAVPLGATSASHPRERALFKACMLGVQYGMAAESLAQRVGEPVHVGRTLLQLHKRTYPKFWRWSSSAVDHAMLFRFIQSVFGWRLNVAIDANPRSLANFPCQANGAEMLRLACCLLTERGIRVCAPIHDAVLIEGSLSTIEDVVDDAKTAMKEASRMVLSGFELQTTHKTISYPDRFMDERGTDMWHAVMRIVGGFKR